QDDIYLLKYDPAGNLLWDTTWNSPASLDDGAVDMQLDGSGNVLVLGNVEPDNVPGSEDICLLKFNSNGGLLWQYVYDNLVVQSGKDEAAGMVLDASGNAYLCGRSFGATSDYDYITMKVNGATGAGIWTMRYDNTAVNGDDRATAICLDHVGNVLVTGRSDNGSNDDIRTIKYEPVNGILQWTRFYAGSLQQDDRGASLTVDGVDNVYVAGYTDVNSSTLTNYDYILLKYNSAGTLQWSRTEAGPALQSDVPVEILAKGNSKIIVTGYSDSNADPNITDNSVWTVCYGSGGGAPLWQDRLNGTRTGGDNVPSGLLSRSSEPLFRIVGFLENNSTQGDGLFLTYDTLGARTINRSHNGTGDYSSAFNSVRLLNPLVSQTVAAGYAYQEGQEKNALIELMTSNGQAICSYIYNGTADEDDQFNAMTVDFSLGGAGMVYAAGFTKVSGQKSDFLLVKFNPSTCDTVWTRTYNHTTNQTDRLVDVVTDNAGNIYVTGYSDAATDDTLDNLDIVTMKYTSAGAVSWIRRYDGSGSLRDEPSKILVARNGNILVCGRTENAQNDDMILLRYDQTTGNPVWATPAIYNSSFANDDRALSMVNDGNDNVFMCGYSQTGQGLSTDDAVVVRVNLQGALTNVYNYDGTGSGNDQALSIATDLSNNVYVAIRTDINSDPLLNDYGIAVLSLNNQLTSTLWGTPATINSSIGGDATPVALAYYGSELFLTGFLEYSNPLSNDILLSQISSTGQVTWIQTYDGPAAAEDESTFMAFDSNAIIIAGTSDGLPTRQPDGVVLTYSLLTGIPDIQQQGQAVVYPNPAINLLSWKSAYDLSEVRLVDLAGRTVLLIDHVSTNSVAVSEVPAGIYQLILKGDQGTSVHKISILHHD
ncbi:MAG: SBBP repeat-containing protein, partial [Bacteroidota bacterium]